MEGLLNGRTALVTGASRGVGKQISFALAQLGCRIIIHARKASNLAETIQLLENIGAEYKVVEGDFSFMDQVVQILRQLKSDHEKVDILYNNAGWGTPYKSDIYEHSWEDWEKSFRINVIAQYSLISALLPVMIERKFGRIINLTSGIKGQPELAPYSASKAAVDKMTKDIACAVPEGVRINTLDPGWLKTDLGGQNAEHPVWAVLPGALIPVFISDNGPNGQLFSAINYDQSLSGKYGLEDIKPAKP